MFRCEFARFSPSFDFFKSLNQRYEKQNKFYSRYKTLSNVIGRIKENEGIYHWWKGKETNSVDLE